MLETLNELLLNLAAQIETTASNIDSLRVIDDVNAALDGLTCFAVREGFGAFVVVDPSTVRHGRRLVEPTAGSVFRGAEGHKAGDVNDLANIERFSGGNDVFQATHVDAVELLRRGEDLGRPQTWSTIALQERGEATLDELATGLAKVTGDA